MTKDLLTLSDLSARDIDSLIARAFTFKKKGKRNRLKILSGSVVGLLFEKESTRTRVSFEVALMKLGGAGLYLGRDSSQLSRGETYADTARVLSRYLDGIVFRTSLQGYLEEMARHATIPIINGLSDQYHPCQVLADLMTVRELKGVVRKIKIAWLGDGNNMANTWIEAALLLGFELRVATPKGFGPLPSLVSRCQSVGTIHLGHDPREAIQRADVVNTDTWFSMGQTTSPEKRAAFSQFQINQKILSFAARNAIVLHCLPAHREEEITSDVLDGPQSAVVTQAENRLYIQMALLEKLLVKRN